MILQIRFPESQLTKVQISIFLQVKQSDNKAKLIKSFTSFCAADSSFIPKINQPDSLFTNEELEFFSHCANTPKLNANTPILIMDSKFLDYSMIL